MPRVNVPEGPSADLITAVAATAVGAADTVGVGTSVGINAGAAVAAGIAVAAGMAVAAGAGCCGSAGCFGAWGASASPPQAEIISAPRARAIRPNRASDRFRVVFFIETFFRT